MSSKRQKVDGYIEIYYRDIMVNGRLTGQKRADRSFYARCTIDGRRKNVYLGRRSDGLTPAKAANMRQKIIAGMPVKLPEPKKRKFKVGLESLRRMAPADDYLKGVDPESLPADYWTFDRLFALYLDVKGDKNYSGRKIDIINYRKHLKPLVGDMAPQYITLLKQKTIAQSLSNKNVTIYGFENALLSARRDYKQAKTLAARRLIELRIKVIERKIKNSKKPLAPATVQKIMGLLQRICNFAVDNDLCLGPPKKIKIKEVDNKKTEDMTPDQIKRLFFACTKDPNQAVADMIRLALVTGLRRGSLFDMVWQHVNFQKSQIYIKSIAAGGRHSKSGKQIIIPMSDLAKKILLQRRQLADLTYSPYVFPGKDGGRRRSVAKAARRIARAAGLPDDFRPLHGLRHSFATNLANTGQVDMYQLQKLLGHQTPLMTQRYSHLRDDALKKAADLMGDIVTTAAGGRMEEKSEEKKAVG